MKVVRLSALRTGRLFSPGNTPGTHLCWRLSQPQGHSAAGKITSMKNSSDTNGNRTRDLPARSAVSQPTAPPRVRVWVYPKSSSPCWYIHSADICTTDRVNPAQFNQNPIVSFETLSFATSQREALKCKLVASPRTFNVFVRLFARKKWTAERTLGLFIFIYLFFYCCTVHFGICRVHSPTNARFYFKKHIKIYIKIHINIAPTCFGLRPSSGSPHWTWLKLYLC